jgi:putative transposase
LIIALEYWMEIPIHFPHGRLDEFIIMPNHLHGILILDYSIVGPHHRVALRHSPENDTVSIRDGMAMDQGHHTNQFSKPLKNSVSVIINQYKSSVKRWCNKNRFKHFEWQSRFYDHIVYDECSVDNIRAYIKNNPSDWCEDDLFI